jgi:hypothetical protein
MRSIFAISLVGLVASVVIQGCGTREVDPQPSSNSIPRYSIKEVHDDRARLAQHIPQDHAYKVDNSKEDVQIRLNGEVSRDEQLTELKSDVHLIENFLSKYDRLYYVENVLTSGKPEEILHLRKVLKKMKELVTILERSKTITADEISNGSPHNAGEISNEALAHIDSDEHIASLALLVNYETTLEMRKLRFFIKDQHATWVRDEANHRENSELREKQTTILRAYIKASKCHQAKFGEEPEFDLKIKLALAEETLKRLQDGKNF